MGKIVNINGVKMMMDDDGKLHPIDTKYYDVNELHSNNFALKRPVKEEKVNTDINLFNSLENKSRPKSTVVVKMVLNESTLQFLESNEKNRMVLYNKYGLHHVPHMLSSDVTHGVIYIYFDDDRFEVISVDNKYKKRLHFAEKLLGEDE